MSIAEIHIYWKGAAMEHVTIEKDGQIADLPPCVTRVYRDARPGELPIAEVTMIARVVEHGKDRP